MGIFSNLNIIYLKEADDDEDNFDINPEDNEENTGNNNITGENNDRNTEPELDLQDNNIEPDDEPEPQTGEENNRGQTDNNDPSIEEPVENNGDSKSQDTGDQTTNEENSDNNTANEDNEDFTIDNGEDDVETNNIEDGETTYNTNIDNMGDNAMDDPKSKFDAALYDSLSDAEKANKNSELLANYKDLYINCDNIIEKINDIDKDSNNIKQIQKIACTLSDLKSYISHYLDNTYKNKSYYENDIMFNKYLAILNGVKFVLKDLESENVEKNEKSKT